ncbi:uncharacterized protein sytl2a isoform X2 [Thalassophryne amazonica]|uniref:uncharacterized protein sytl2a isoform X2 n=1 Tax=Thalassophryne amazonica TaxID=390379 RepID=UPI001471DCA2|nr:uncharacterized protein sytl2a isoform X2 [Thalassophryne amazonica]
MIDLSFLTEEEQEAIQAVLQRDAALKKIDERRVQKLQRTTTDKDQLKYMTGDWFYEAKMLRHKDRIHGSDIIRASIKRSPLTILEISQVAPERPSFIASENKEVFVPPELSGLLQEPHRQPSTKRDQRQRPDEKPVLHSSTKERPNPFNSQLSALAPIDEVEHQLLDEPEDQTQISCQKPFSPSDSSISYTNKLKQDPNNSPLSQNASITMTGTPKFGTSPQDWYVGVDVPEGRHDNFSASRGILKHMSTSSFTDSLCSSLELQSSVSLDSPEPFPDRNGEDLGWLDRKQVRVGSPAGGLQDVKILGEYSSLDVNSVTNNQVGNDGLVNPGSATAATRRPFLKQEHVDSREGELCCTRDTILQKQDADKKQVIGGLYEQRQVELQSHQLYTAASAVQRSSKTTSLQKKPEDDCHSQAPSTVFPSGSSIPQAGQNLFEHDNVSVEPHSDTKHSSPIVSPKHMQKLIAFFRGEEKFTQLHGSDMEKEKLPKQKELDDTTNPSHSNADMTMVSQVKCQEETRPPVMTQVPTWQSAVAQDNPFNDPLRFGDSDVGILRKETTSGDTAKGSSLKGATTLGTSYVGNPFKQKMALGESDVSNPFKETPILRDSHVGILSQGTMTVVDSDVGNRFKETRVLRDSDIANCFKERLALGSPDVGNPFKDDITLEGPNVVIQQNADEHISIEGNAAKSQKEVSTTQTEFNPVVDVLKQDGTYRVNPVLIYEDTEDPSQTGSQMSVTPLVTSLSSTTEQQGDIQVTSPEENRHTNKSEITHLWSREHLVPKTDPRIVKASSTSVHSKLSSSPIMSRTTNAASPQCDLTTSIDEEKTEAGEQISSYRTKSIVILKSKNQPDEGLINQGSDRTHWRQINVTEDVPSPCQQHQSQAHTEAGIPQEITLNPSLLQTPRTKGQDDEARKSSFKTFYPKVRQIQSASPMGSTWEGSLLRTFPIDINPQQKVIEGQVGTTTPVPKPRKIPLTEAKQVSFTDPTTTTEIISCPLPLEPRYSGQGKETCFVEITTQETSPRLARSFIPRDYQHYLGPKEKAHLPPFHKEKVIEEHRGKPSVSAAETNEVYKPQIVSTDFVGNQTVDTTEENPSHIWTLHQASSNSIEDDSSPVGSALKHLPSRSMSSRSLENLSGMGNKVTSSTEDEGARSDTRHDIVITVDDVSEPSSSSPPPPPLSLSRSKEMKMSSSVPILQMDEADSDGAFEHVDWRRSTGSSASNLSLSSGMASMSSISSSTMSLYRTDYGNLEVQGTIQFALNYIQKLAEFHIFVVQCKDLAVAEPKKNRSDPYVKCYLLPYKTKMGKKKTSVKKKSVNPTYNEILRFKIVMEELKRQNLNVSVWHNDTFGRNAFLGEVDLDLSEWDFNNTQINEYTLKPRASVQPSTPSESFEFDGAAEMRVALRFLPQMSHSKKMSNIETGEVQIWVKDCKNLRPVRDAIIDPFVKCTVLPDMSRKNRQKTRVVRRTSNPMFNHTMVYDGLRPSDLREACMEITVWDHDKRTNHFIGGLRLGLGTGKSYGVDAVWMDSTQDEAHLWQKMMMSHGEWVEDVLPLRMFLMARSMPK